MILQGRDELSQFKHLNIWRNIRVRWWVGAGVELGVRLKVKVVVRLRVRVRVRVQVRVQIRVPVFSQTIKLLSNLLN